MSFIRPEAAAALVRWRDALIGLGLIGVGAWWAMALTGILSWVGYGLLPIGAALALVGLQRARFRGASGGPGLVQVDEGRVIYFGPLTGGTADLAELSELVLDRSGKPAHWSLRQPGQPPLVIPVTATGSDALFDAFATLPGLRTERILAAVKAREDDQIHVWSRAP